MAMDQSALLELEFNTASRLAGRLGFNVDSLFEHDQDLSTTKSPSWLPRCSAIRVRRSLSGTMGPWSIWSRPSQLTMPVIFRASGRMTASI